MKTTVCELKNGTDTLEDEWGRLVDHVGAEKSDLVVLPEMPFPHQNLPNGLFSDLYHSRWPVEENYKIIKSRIELENFSGKSALSVYQDFHAKVLMKNIVSLFVLH